MSGAAGGAGGGDQKEGHKEERGKKTRLAEEEMGEGRLACSLMNTGRSLHSEGKLDVAQEKLAEALEIWLKLFGSEHEAYITTLTMLGDVYSDQGKYDLTISAYEEALGVQLKESGLETLAVADKMDVIARCTANLGKFQQSLKGLEEVLRIQKAILGDEHPDVAITLSCIADVREAQASADRASSDFSEGLEHNRTLMASLAAGDSDALQRQMEAMILKGRTTGDDHNLASSLSVMGEALLTQGRNAEALEKHTESLELYRKLYGKEDEHYAITLACIGRIYFIQSKHNLALRACEEALEIQLRVHGRDALAVAWTLETTADVHLNLGNNAEAFRCHKEMMRIRKVAHGSEHPGVESPHALDGNGQDESGNMLQMALQEQLRSQKQSLGDQHPDVGQTLLLMANMHGAQGSEKKARELYLASAEVYAQVWGPEDSRTLEVLRLAK